MVFEAILTPLIFSFAEHKFSNVSVDAIYYGSEYFFYCIGM